MDPRADFDRAIEEIRRAYDLDLTPDANGVASVRFSGDVVCTLEAPSDAASLYFHCVIERASPADRGAACERLLRLNAFELPVPNVWTALDAETSEFLLCGTLPFAGTTAESLGTTLTAAAGLVTDLRDMLREPLPAEEDAPFDPRGGDLLRG